MSAETGVGNGLLTVADLNLDYVEPTSYADLDAIASGAIFKEKKTLVIDSLTAITKTLIKDKALSIPRARGESDKRRIGIPELDDYGSMGELARRFVSKLHDTYGKTHHIIVTALEKYDKAGPDDPPGTESLITPDLPGALALATPAMFDLVLRMRTRPVLKTPGDPKSRYNQRYLQCEQVSGIVAKSRLNVNGKQLRPILAPEEIVDLETGSGTFPALLDKVLAAYKESSVSAVR